VGGGLFDEKTEETPVKKRGNDFKYIGGKGSLQENNTGKFLKNTGRWERKDKPNQSGAEEKRPWKFWENWTSIKRRKITRRKDLQNAKKGKWGAQTAVRRTNIAT